MDAKPTGFQKLNIPKTKLAIEENKTNLLIPL